VTYVEWACSKEDREARVWQLLALIPNHNLLLINKRGYRAKRVFSKFHDRLKGGEGAHCSPLIVKRGLMTLYTFCINQVSKSYFFMAAAETK
jgi:hypothetical protein